MNVLQWKHNKLFFISRFSVVCDEEAEWKTSSLFVLSPPTSPSLACAALRFLYVLYTKAVHKACSRNFSLPPPIPSNWDVIGQSSGRGRVVGWDKYPCLLMRSSLFSLPWSQEQCSDFYLTSALSFSCLQFLWHCFNRMFLHSFVWCLSMYNLSWCKTEVNGQCVCSL